MPYLESHRNFRLWYTDSGSGNPVLFIHGWCMASDVWQMQQAVISPEFRFISLDLNGHGRSELPPERLHGFEGYAADIEEIIVELDLRNLVIVGWSMGAQALIKAYPAINSSVKGMVLVGATPRFTAAPHFPFALNPSEAQGMRVKVKRSLERALDGFKQNIMSGVESSHEITDTVSAILSTLPYPSREAAIDGLDALMEEEVMPLLPAITIPVLIIHGGCDTICLPSASEYLEKHIKFSQRICYENAGHAPFLTMPLRFNNDLQTFVRQVNDVC